MSALDNARAALASWVNTEEPTYPELSRNGWALYEALSALTVPPADDEREALADEISRHNGVIHYSDNGFGGRDDTGGLRCHCGWSAPRESESRLRPWREYHRHVADAVAGFRRQKPITDAQVEAAANAIYDHRAYQLNGVESERLARAALEAARAA